MDVDLIALGFLAIIVGMSVAIAARKLFPRLDASRESLTSIRYLTALITGLLVAIGLGLLLVGILL